MNDFRAGLFAGLGRAFFHRTLPVRGSVARLAACPMHYPSTPGGLRVALADVIGDGVLEAILAPDPGFDLGYYIAAGDVNADGFADLVLSAGAGGGPRVWVYAGNSILLQASDLSPIADFYAGDAGDRAGATVAVKSFVPTEPGLDLLVATGGTGKLRAFEARTVLTGTTQPEALWEIDAFLGRSVFVG